MARAGARRLLGVALAALLAGCPSSARPPTDGAWVLLSRDAGRTWRFVEPGALEADEGIALPPGPFGGEPASTRGLDLRAVAAAGSGEVFALAACGTVMARRAGQTCFTVRGHLVGAQESVRLDADAPGEGEGLLAASARALVAVGRRGAYESADGGWTWRLATPTDAPLRAVAGGAAGVVAVGDGGRVLHARPGGALEPAASGTERTLRAVWCDGAGVALAAGEGGTLLRSADGGRTWAAVPSGTGATLLAVWGPPGAAGTVFVAGADGTLLASADGGRTWVARPTGTRQALRGLGGVGALVVALGDAGTVLVSTDGGATLEDAAPSLLREHDRAPRAACATPAGELVVAGAPGVLCTARPDGLRWRAHPAPWPTHRPARALWGASLADLHVVGDDGWAARSTDGGTTWATLPTGAQGDLLDVAGAAADDVYACGERGALARFDGTSWSPLASGADDDLTGVACAGGVVLVVGQRGTILRSADRGASWTRQACPVDRRLEAVTLDASGRGWAGGVYALLRTDDAGRTWSEVATDLRGSSFTDLCSPAPDELWGSILGGTLVHSLDGGRTFAAVDGAAHVRALSSAGRRVCGAGGGLFQARDGDWSQVVALGGPSPWGLALADVHVLGEDAAVAVGRTGTYAEGEQVLLGRGVAPAWRMGALMPPHVDALAWDPARRAGLAVGAWGTLWRSGDAGATWAPTDAGVEVTLAAAALRTPRDALVVGEAGTALVTTDAGTTWVQRPCGTTRRLLAAWAAPDAPALWAAGEEGTVVASQDGGLTWGVEATGSTARLVALAGAPGRLLAAGAGGALLERGADGAWRALPTPSPADLAGVWVGPDALVAVGERGTLLRATDSDPTLRQVDVPGARSWDLGPILPCEGGALVVLLRRTPRRHFSLH